MPTRSTVRLTASLFSERRPRPTPENPHPKEVEIWDAEANGLLAWLYPSGRITLLVGYRAGKRARRFRLGEYLHPLSAPLLEKLPPTRRQGRVVLALDIARELTARIRQDVRDGFDPRAEARKMAQKPRVSEFIDTFLGRAGDSRKARTVEEIRRHLERARDAWRDMRIDLVTPDQVRALAARVKAAASENPRATRGGDVEMSRFLAALSALFTAAFRDGHVTENVLRRVERPKRSAARRRVPDDAEMRALLTACTALKEADPYGTLAIEMLALTGARLREVLLARWEHVKLEGERPSWLIPAENSKTTTDRVLPLAPALAERLSETPRTSRYVIAGRSPLKPRADLKKAWSRALERAGLLDSGLTLHDLRRRVGLDLFSSFGADLTSKVLGHSTPSVTSTVYAPLTAEHMRPAVDQRSGELLDFQTKPRKKRAGKARDEGGTP